MKIIITHSSPDMDAITSVWLLKKFLPGWENSEVKFVPAGERLTSSKLKAGNLEQDPIEVIGDDEVIHVDTGLGPLDHHQTSNENVCGASLTWDFVKIKNEELKTNNSEKTRYKLKAVSRMVKVVVDIDHFKEVFWKDATADYHEFSLTSILDGLKVQKPNQDELYVGFVMNCLDAVYHEFENRIWAEEEIAKNSQKFTTRFGDGIGFETINDSVIKLAQKMGYVVAFRKDPRKGYVRIKALPSNSQSTNPKSGIDLTLAYEKLKKMDPDATWYLHVSKKMLLNGSVKNPKMKPTKLKLKELISVLETI